MQSFGTDRVRVATDGRIFLLSRLEKAWRLSDSPVTRPPHVLARVDKDGVTKAL